MKVIDGIKCCTFCEPITLEMEDWHCLKAGCQDRIVDEQCTLKDWKKCPFNLDDDGIEWIEGGK